MSASKGESQKKTIERLTTERDLLRIMIANFEEKWKKAEDTVAKLTEELRTVRAENLLATQQSQGDEISTSSQVDISVPEKTISLEKYAALHTDHENVLVRYKDMCAQYKSLGASLATLTNQNDENSAVIEQLNMHLKEAALLADEYNTLKDEHTTLKDEHTTLTTDFENLSARESALSRYVEEWKTMGETWKTESAKFRTTIADLSAANNALNTEVKMLIAKNKDLEEAIEEWTLAEKSWAQTNEQLEIELEEKNLEVSRLLAENIEYSKSLACSHSENEVLRSHICNMESYTREIENAQAHELEQDSSNSLATVQKLKCELELSNKKNEELVTQIENARRQSSALQSGVDPQSQHIKDLEEQLNTLQQSIAQQSQNEADLNLGFQASMQQRQTDAQNAIKRLQDELPMIRGNEKRAVEEIIECLQQGLREPNAQTYFDTQRAHLKNQLYILQFTSKSLLNTMLNVITSIVAFCGAGIVLSLTGHLQKNQDKYGSSLAFNLFGVVGAKQRAQGNIQAVVNALDVVYRP